MKQRDVLTRPQRILVGIVATGAVVIAGIGFAGSYTAVQTLARAKGFGAFANWFPIGIDAGIVVLLALDLLLTWFRMPYPLLRPAAWLLTAATIAFNAAAAWPDPIGVGMHAVIPALFVVAVEAARHAVGRTADLTADRHVEPVPLRRWLLAFPSTFRLWRRMHLWQIRTVDEALALEQQTLIYRSRLRAKHGRRWRRKAPVESVLPLRLTRYGVALDGAVQQLTHQSTPELPAAGTAPAPAPEAERPEVRTSDAPEQPAPVPAPAAPFVLDLARMDSHPHPDVCAPAPVAALDQPRRTRVHATVSTAPPAAPAPVRSRKPEPKPAPHAPADGPDPLLNDARALPPGPEGVPTLRTLKNQLGIGQTRAQALQAALKN